MVRLLHWAEELFGAPELVWRNHSRIAKKRIRMIRYTRGKEKKVPLYKDLVQVTGVTLVYVRQARLRLTAVHAFGIGFEQCYAQVAHYTPLIERVIDRTKRRVFAGEKVPDRGKIFSLFEERRDLIVKGSRGIQYGHKLNLASGRSGLILDIVIEDSNPADAERFLPMVNRPIELLGILPDRWPPMAAYASGANVQAAKGLGVQDVAFHKKRGLSIEAMVKSLWVYRKLRNFRADIEAGISCLKPDFDSA